MNIIKLAHETDFDGWRDAARRLVLNDVAPSDITWLVDGDQFYVKTPEGVIQSGQRWVYDHPFFIILNLAIGGIFDGDPDASTAFPQQMQIDYISVSALSGT